MIVYCLNHSDKNLCSKGLSINTLQQIIENEIREINEKKKSYFGLNFYFFMGFRLLLTNKTRIFPGLPLRDYPTLMEECSEIRRFREEIYYFELLGDLVRTMC